MNKQKKLKVCVPLTQSYQKSPLVKATPVQTQVKNAPDALRHLRNELDRYKNENYDLREEKSYMTQQYLHLRDQNTELIQKLEQMKKQWDGQEKFIEEKVQRGIQVSHQEILSKVKNQQVIIDKLRLQKVLLGKNVWDMQERLKATRHELHLTQKHLYSLQDVKNSTTNLDDEPQTLSVTKQSSKTNKVMHLNGPLHDYNAPDNMELSAKMDNKENQRSNNHGLRMEKNVPRNGARNNLMVAKSLAVARTTQNTGLGGHDAKYNWLFNDEETPREQQVEHQDTKNADTKLMRHLKYQGNVCDQVTQANSNFQRHSGPQNDQFQDENLTDTMQSVRENADDVLLTNKRSHKQENSQNRESLVGKSLQGMKNMFRKAKEGDFHGLMSRTSLGTNSRSNTRVIGHEQVQIEFQMHDSVQNEENPLDDDSN